MTSPSSNCAVLAVGVVLVSALAGCGFSDTLTSRGFIEEGDQICIDTLVKAGISLNDRATLSGSQFLATIGSAYGSAAGRFRRLQIRSDDEAMRDRVVAGYSSFSRRLQAAARSGVPGGGSVEARRVFADASALQRSMKAYGFTACGGGGSPS
jgi:hypothetical protein